ncbi:MBL fold metallo-hydrolase [Salmonirosea aquatica]|uniref:MBL fold metallo-hydrolase n=1 Tax=Salmonirosea aquatica TaxID=2654236 RepID=A0A7C9FBX8_9BACT|nr:MBL fold metallo-hydrolase [Cytophagaceae bacterium SJW1-29]
MKIKQFEDKDLAHYAYAILSECEQKIILIDPARDPKPYYDYAEENNAKIVGVIETHPHADFVSSHLEIHEHTGATIYAHSLTQAGYPHKAFDEGAELTVGKIKLKALHTPGHSPDSISVVLEHDGRDKAVFTGDTLFVGDVGRPDLRENAGNSQPKREELARQMYHSTRDKLMKLDSSVVVYPAHGAGTLCGKNLGDASSSTIGEEIATNSALQPMSEEEFVNMIVEDQPFVPRYFGYDVALNEKGAPNYRTSVEAVKRLPLNHHPTDNALVIDGRKENIFKKGHYRGALNIQEGAKFETWLGSIVAPEEPYYLVADQEESLENLIAKAAKIGYELFIKGTFVLTEAEKVTSPKLDRKDFEANPEHYTIVDVRNASEVEKQAYFEHAINIPLPELRERAAEVPREKPVVVHCASGYRSAIGSSLLEAALPGTPVIDLGEAVKDFMPQTA